MKKRFSLMLIMLVLFSSMFIISCSDDSSTDPVKTKYEILSDYMTANSMDITAITTNWIKTAAAVNTVMTDTLVTGELDTSNDYYIMDIRAASAYDVGHIPGAHNVAFADVVTHAEANVPSGQTIAVVCYSGQSASHAVVALRLSGYADAFSIMWGMSGWHTNIDLDMDGDLTDPGDVKFDSWTASCATLTPTANWTAAPGAIADPIIFDYPTITTEKEDGAEILAERVNSMLAGGFKGVSAATVLADPSAYFINNYWTTTDVTTYGNIAGAYRINPLVLNNLNPAKQIVTYCWTGQTSSIVTAYLTVLGYDAVSLKNGANAMIYGDLLGHKWDASTIVDLPIAITP